MPKNDPEYMKGYMREYRARKRAANKEVPVDDGIAALVEENARLVEEVRHLKQLLAERDQAYTVSKPVFSDDDLTKAEMARLSRVKPSVAIENADAETVDWLEKKQREAYASFHPVPKPGSKKK